MSDDPTVPGGPAASVDLAEALTLGADGPPPKVGVGDRFGRFAVRGVLGIGGMGVVLEGYDPTLDRPVAIKVMSSAPDPASASAGETRMVREAKAMAKLSHPNVVRVYEVGSNRAGLYMVMELIDGVTLARWLDEPRPWRQVLERFLAAGRGLAAAHAAELVHRDFKPSNVLLGRDGRVLVSDFGLVSVAAAAPERPVDGATVGGLDVSTGVLLGTPRYMAPEQHQRGAVDPRADQWAFCASLWEGLFGAHPFAADTLAVLVMRVLSDDPPAAPTDRGVPPHIREALRRGLARDPAARFASMDELLVELARDPARTRRRALLAVGAVVALTGAGALGWSRAAPEPARDPCRDLMAPAWSAAGRDEVTALFRTARPGLADDTVARVGDRLDRYFATWKQVRAEVCRDSDRASPAFLERMTCLARARGEVAALLSVFAESADPAVVEGAVGAVSALPSLDACRGGAALAAATPLATGGDEVRTAIHRSRALYRTGRLADSVAAAERAVAGAAGWPALEGASLLALGIAQERLDTGPAAIATLTQAGRAAAAGRDDETVARAWLELMWALSQRDRAAEALAIAPLVEAALARIGAPPRTVAELAYRRGSALVELGRYDEAVVLLEEARAIHRVHGATDELEASRVLGTLGNVAGYRGDLHLAHTLKVEALAATERELGPNHPRVAQRQISLGGILLDLGDLDGARALCQRADAVLLAALGDTAQRSNGLRCIAGAEHLSGRTVEAEAAIAAALAHDTGPPATSFLPYTLVTAADLALGRGDAEDALALAERADALLAHHASDRWRSAARVIAARTALGRPPGDLRALEAWRASPLGPPHDRGVVWFALARARAADGRLAEARELAVRARAEFTTAAASIERATVDAWLSTR